jgi:hypothetical protein
MLILIGFLMSVGLDAQAVLNDIHFVPPTFFVGDHVELHISFDVEGPIAVEAPVSFPEADWVEIRDISVQVENQTVSIIIAFIPFAPGTRALPSMEFGALQLTDIKVPTHSILQNNHESVRSLRGQLLMPGTKLAVALILALAAMAPFLAYGLFRITWNWFRKSRELYRIGRPARKLRRLMKKLKFGIGTVKATIWYYQLTEGLKTYFSARIGHDCLSATTAEISVMQDFSDDDTPQTRLLDVLKEGDLVKFAGRFADDRSLHRTLETVNNAVAEWEKIHAQL